MGIDYSAMLFFGIQLSEEFTEVIQEKYEGEFERYIAEKLNVTYWSSEYEKMIVDLNISFTSNSVMGDYKSYYLIHKDTYYSADFNPEKFDMPVLPKEEMVQPLRKACEKLGLDFQEPKWILVLDMF